MIGCSLPWRPVCGRCTDRAQKWLRRCEYFTEDASQACDADRVVQKVQLHPVGRLWAPIFPCFGRGQHTGSGAQWEGKSAPPSDEDNSPSVVVAEVDIEASKARVLSTGSL